MQFTISQERQMFDQLHSGVAYIALKDGNGDHHMGTCFHIGEDVFITARHVVEGSRITSIGTVGVVRKSSSGTLWTSAPPKVATEIDGPFFHSNPDYDLAALRLRGLGASQIPFMDVLDDRFDNEVLLRAVLVMGFPPIPGSKEPVLVCARGEVSASFITYFDRQRAYVISCMARGGFSGAPAVTFPHHCLGVVTRSLLRDSQPEELGFMTVIGPLPVLELLDQHRMMPDYLKTQLWEPFRKARNITLQ